MRDPTERQLQLLRILYDHWYRRAPQPTVRELGDMLGIASPNGVQDHLLALAKKGYLHMPRFGHSRSNTLTQKALDFMGHVSQERTVLKLFQLAEHCSLTDQWLSQELRLLAYQLDQVSQ